LKQNKVFNAIGIILAVAAVCFIGYAITHPDGNFPWSNDITYGIYLVYPVITITMFILGSVFRKKNNSR